MICSIQYDDSIDGIVEGQYCVISSGEILRRFRTHMRAEAWVVRTKKWVLESCEQSSDDKKDYPEKDSPPSKVSVVSVSRKIREVDFGRLEVIDDNNEIVATIEADGEGNWDVGSHKFATYKDAEVFALTENADNMVTLEDKRYLRFDIIHPSPYKDGMETYYCHERGTGRFLGFLISSDQGWSIDGNRWLSNPYDAAEALQYAMHR